MTGRTQTGSLAAPGAADPAPWLPQAPVRCFISTSPDVDTPATRSASPGAKTRCDGNRGADSTSASAPWLPLAPARCRNEGQPSSAPERSATRSSLRVPRSDDAVRAAFERSRGAVEQPSSAPAERFEQPSSAPAEKVRAALGRPQVPLLAPFMVRFTGLFHSYSLMVHSTSILVRRECRPAPALAPAAPDGPKAAAGRQRPRRTRPFLSRRHPARGA